MTDFLDRYATMGDLERLMEKGDAERTQRMLEAERQVELEARKEAIKKRVRSKPVVSEKEPEIDPDAIYSAGEPLSPDDSDDWPLMVSGRKRKRRSKTKSTVSPEPVDPDRTQRLIKTNMGNLLLADLEDDTSENPFLTYGHD